jgi:phosphatidylinositol N-acetylglucosaminyltransferase subunit Q
VLFFLFPTIAVYYLFFSLVRFLVTLVQALLWFAIIFFNHFPFFSLIVFAIDPRRLPGGIQLEVIAARSFPDGSTLRTTYLALHNASFPVSALFTEYKRGVMRMLEYYSIDKALLCFLYGLRYPVTPALVEDKSTPDEVISVPDLWQFLTVGPSLADVTVAAYTA